MGKRENKKLSFRFVSTRRIVENFKKIAKKLEILKKKTLLRHFKRKYVKILKKIENKNYRSVSFLPDA